MGWNPDAEGCAAGLRRPFKSFRTIAVRCCVGEAFRYWADEGASELLTPILERRSLRTLKERAHALAVASLPIPLREATS
jgi:hypothetical protein